MLHYLIQHVSSDLISTGATLEKGVLISDFISQIVLSLVFCAEFCRLLFLLLSFFLWHYIDCPCNITSTVLRFTASNLSHQQNMSDEQRKNVIKVQQTRYKKTVSTVMRTIPPTSTSTKRTITSNQRW